MMTRMSLKKESVVGKRIGNGDEPREKRKKPF